MPETLSAYALNLKDDGRTLVDTFDPKGERTGTTQLLSDLSDHGNHFTDMDTRQSSLEEIFVSLVGFIIGIGANNFEKLQFIPVLVITPLTFLGGSFYSIDMPPAFWRALSLFNPVVYLISAFRWSLYGTADVPVALSIGIIGLFLAVCIGIIWWIFKTGYRLKN